MRKCSINSLCFMVSSLDKLSERLAKSECEVNYSSLRNNFKYTSDVFQYT